MTTKELLPHIPHKIRNTIIGPPRSIKDPKLFHKLALIPVLAWIGLGGDGLSSSSYGPEAAFGALGQHTYLALVLALATAFTVFIISYAYSRIIEHFPSGGGGYIVATQTLGEKAGVISGSALLVDYVLTITVSIAACGDAIFSFFPMSYQPYKIPFEIAAVVVLIILNLRGVKESVTFMAPIFIVFVLTHALMIGYGIFSHVPDIGPLAERLHADYRMGLTTLGAGGMLLLFFRAFSLGGGTYHRDRGRLQRAPDPPRAPGPERQEDDGVHVHFPGRHGGRHPCLLPALERPAGAGQDPERRPRGTASSAAGRSVRSWPWSRFSPRARCCSWRPRQGSSTGPGSWPTWPSTTGFPTGSPRSRTGSRSRTACCSWAARPCCLILYSRGSILTLVVMYSINVFLTFTLSQLGMSRFTVKNRKREEKWKRNLAVHLVGLAL